MCRNIKTLANFEPPATDNEIRASALQFVRKLSGSTHPSRANEEAFDRAVAVGLAFGNARRHCRKRVVRRHDTGSDCASPSYGCHRARFDPPEHIDDGSLVWFRPISLRQRSRLSECANAASAKRRTRRQSNGWRGRPSCSPPMADYPPRFSGTMGRQCRGPSVDRHPPPGSRAIRQRRDHH